MSLSVNNAFTIIKVERENTILGFGKFVLIATSFLYSPNPGPLSSREVGKKAETFTQVKRLGRR
jgi:hypothetical protein